MGLIRLDGEWYLEIESDGKNERKEVRKIKEGKKRKKNNRIMKKGTKLEKLKKVLFKTRHKND